MARDRGMTITLMIGSIRSSIYSYRGSRSRSRSDPIHNLNFKGDTVCILAMRHFFLTQLLTSITREGFVRFTWQLASYESPMGTLSTPNFKWFWHKIPELLRSMIVIIQKRSSIDHRSSWWSRSSISIDHDSHSLILGTCWTTFVFMSMLKSEYL